MIKAKDIPEYLLDLQQQNPHAVHIDLVRGQEISTHGYQASTSYLIDEPDIHRVFGYPDEFGEFLLELGKRLQGGTGAEVLNKLFPPGKKVCNISEAVQREVGACMEKATIVALRRKPDCRVFIVKGVISSRYGKSNHAFNILESHDDVYLTDAQNPIIAIKGEQRIYYPFNFPLTGYNETSNVFVFKEPYESNIQWKYELSIPRENVRYSFLLDM